MTREAFGRPGIEPRWTRSSKDGLGTAYSTASRVWFTLSHGGLNEIYFPTVDSPQVRDFEFLFSDGGGFFQEEKRDLKNEISALDGHGLGWRVTGSDPGGRYRLIKEIVSDPHLPCVLLRCRLEGDEAFLKTLRVYALLAPHLEGRGLGNNAGRAVVSGREMLTAHRDGIRLALGATVPFARTSCGFVGASDGWTDLRKNFRLTWDFDSATDGNVAVVGELDLSKTREFTVGIAFGFGLHGATSVLLQSLGIPFEAQKERYLEQWNRACAQVARLDAASGDGGRLYRVSNSLLMAHEDKTYPGAIIASLSIPWGESKGDDDGLGGYHLVWTRDMCGSASALLAAGHRRTPLKALIYLAATQLPNGGFYQNFWIDGEPFWTGVQLDEAAFPILLAWRLREAGALEDFDPLPMVLKAAAFLVERSPVTPQERWEESAGISPSTLAAVISALVCAAAFARASGDGRTAAFLEDHADFLESRVEDWTTTTRGALLPGVARHYIRILPMNPDDPEAPEDPNEAVLTVKNAAPGARRDYPAREIVDAGFLELVRYGVRAAGTPLMEDSLRVIDAVLKFDAPAGPCWRRYNHDGYGQAPDGGPFTFWGQGRPWPLLTGERGHYELAAGRDPGPYLRAMEGFASPGGMLPEQMWDAKVMPSEELFPGRPSGSAMPLMWAHAEYVKLLRSAADGAVFDRLSVVADRYLDGKGRKDLEVWSSRRRVRRVPAGRTVRVLDAAPFRLRWTADEWATARDLDSVATALGLHYADLPVPAFQRAPLRFTFYRPGPARWDGTNYAVSVSEPAAVAIGS